MFLLETTRDTLVEACKEREGQRQEVTIRKRSLSYQFIERGKRNGTRIFYCVWSPHAYYPP
jgi:hypothetical protein